MWHAHVCGRHARTPHLFGCGIMSPDEPDGAHTPTPAEAAAAAETSEHDSTSTPTVEHDTDTTAAAIQDDMTQPPSDQYAAAPAEITADISTSAPLLDIPTPTPITHPRYMLLSSNSTTPTWNTDMSTDAHVFYIGIFVMLIGVWQCISRVVRTCVDGMKGCLLHVLLMACCHRTSRDDMFRRCSHAYSRSYAPPNISPQARHHPHRHHTRSVTYMTHSNDSNGAMLRCFFS